MIVAVDDDGRPHMTTAATEHAMATAAWLEAASDLEVVAVEPEIPVSAAVTSSATVTSSAAARSSTSTASAVSATCQDPFRSQQWALDVLDMESVWEIRTGDGVDIAVVDSGVDASHPDLVGRVDPGVSFVGTGGVAQVGGGAVDPNGHGTHVAGIAAAGSMDGIGTAGVAPYARILPVRVLDDTGAGYSQDVAAGITWSVDHGAEVINLSLGGRYSGAVAAAVAYAESRGVVVVAAAGNAGTADSVSYPAALDTVIAVAAHDSGGSRSNFSSQGPQVDVAAPGSGILSTYPGSQWRYFNGTSMAAPHVSGSVALMVEVDPSRTPGQLRDLIRTSAVDAGLPGVDSEFGWGRLNTRAALGF